MGDTWALQQEGPCLGRSVTSWMNDCDLWPAGSRARAWWPSARSLGSRARRATSIYTRYKDCGIKGLTDRSRRPHRHANPLPVAVEKVIVRLKREYPAWGAPK